MRTLIFLAIGFLLAAAAILLTKPERRSLAKLIFANVWLVVCIFSLRAGLSRGHSLTAEIPIHVFLFAMPVGLAIRLARPTNP